MMISIVVRTWNDEHCIKECLDAVFAQEVPDTVEFICIDEGSKDRTLEHVRNYPFAAVIPITAFRSGSHTLNTAFARAKGDIIIQVLGHTVPAHRQVFQEMLKPFNNEAVAAVHGLQLPHPRGSVFRNVDFAIGAYTFDVIKKNGSLSCSFFAMRRSVWEHIPFDETIGSGEDKVWSRTVHEKDHRIEFVPSAEVLHCDRLKPLYRFRQIVRKARACKKTGRSRGNFYYSIGYRVRQDIKYIKPKWWLVVSPIERTCEALAYFIGSLC